MRDPRKINLNILFKVIRECTEISDGQMNKVKYIVQCFSGSIFTRPSTVDERISIYLEEGKKWLGDSEFMSNGNELSETISTVPTWNKFDKIFNGMRPKGTLAICSSMTTFNVALQLTEPDNVILNYFKGTHNAAMDYRWLSEDKTIKDHSVYRKAHLGTREFLKHMTKKLPEVILESELMYIESGENSSDSYYKLRELLLLNIDHYEHEIDILRWKNFCRRGSSLSTVVHEYFATYGISMELREGETLIDIFVRTMGRKSSTITAVTKISLMVLAFAFTAIHLNPSLSFSLLHDFVKEQTVLHREILLLWYE